MRGVRLIGGPLLALAMTLVSGCARQSNLQTPEQSTLGQSGDQQTLPFDQQGRKTGGSLVPSSEELPAGTSVTVRLQNGVSSLSSHPGERFDAVIDEPVVVDGQMVLARGTRVEGRIVAAKPSGELHDHGYLRLTLSNMVVNGNVVPLTTSTIFAKGGSHEKRDLAMIAGSAGAGALPGGVAGGGKGALIGTAGGTTSETATAYATGAKDVSFGAERRLTFRLTQAVTLKN
jgi:hypothetical protein